ARRPRRRLEARAGAALQALPARSGGLPRDESHSHQGSDGDDRHAGAGVPAADVPDGRCEPPEAACDPRVVRPREVVAVMTDVVVAGAAGRMGSRIVACLQGDADLKLVAAIEAVGHAACGNDAGEAAGVGRVGIPITSDPRAAITRDRVLIEFSIPEATLAHLQLVPASGARAVIATTGFTPVQRDHTAALRPRAAILPAP